MTQTARFWQVLTSYYRFEQVYTCPNLSKLVRNVIKIYGQFWLILGQFWRILGQFWMILDRFIQVWTILDEIF